MKRKLDLESEKNEEFLTLGGRIRFISKKIGGASELGRRITDVSRNTLQRYIDNDSEPKPSTLIRMAEVSGISFLWLATGEGSPDKGGVDVSAYSGDVIDKHVVAQSVEAVKQYLDKTKEDMDPDAFANAVLAVCDLAPKYGDIDLQLIENIMKLKNSL